MRITGVLLATALALLVQFVVLPRAVSAAVLMVSPGQSINAVIERAEDGDTVLVRPGTYQEAVRLKGGVVLRGQGGAAVTHLVGVADEAVVTAVGSGARTLDGFTLDGDYQARAGVEIDLFSDGAVAITNSRILRNYGPGVEAYLWGSFTRLALAHTLIAANAGPGVQLDIELGSAVVAQNEIVENGSGGCSVYAVDGGDVHLTANVIEGNVGETGGGLALNAGWGAVIRATGNRVGWNRAVHGGGIDAVAVLAILSLVNNAVYQNQAEEHGGLSADIRWESVLECVHNTVAENDAADVGVFIDVTPDSQAQIANNIFWGNGALDYAGPTSHHSVIGTGNNGGAGNLTADPRFYDPEAGDYRLTFRSPCVDHGDSSAVPPDVATDAGGRPRIRGASADPGAYEFVSGRELLADLRAALDTMEETSLVAGRTSRTLRLRLAMAELFLGRSRGAEVWSLYYLGSFIQIVQDQSGKSIQPEAAVKLTTAAQEIYDQIERWGG